MNVKQMTVEDWVATFYQNPRSFSQVEIIERRQKAGLPLATWEWNCLRAARQFEIAAE